MSTEGSGAIPQTVIDAVRAEHGGRVGFEFNAAIRKAQDRIARPTQAPEGTQPLEARSDTLGALEQADSALDGVMAAMCERDMTALQALDSLIDEIASQGDPDYELGILRSLRSALQQNEITNKKEAISSMKPEEVAQEFRRCSILRFKDMMRGDNPPHSFDELEQRLRDIADVLSTKWAMEPAQYAEIKPMASPAYNIAQVKQGREGRTHQTLEIYRETANEFVVGIFKRWIDGKSVTVERRLQNTGRTDKPKASEGLQIAPEYQTSPKKELLLTAVAEMVTALTDQMPVTPEDFSAKWRINSGNGDPVANASMEAISGFFFDGFSQGLSASTDIENRAQFAKQPEDVSALYRGMLIRSLVDGSSEPHAYLVAISHMTTTDVTAVARVALGLLRKMPETDIARDKMATLILMLPRGTVDNSGLDEAHLLVSDTKLQAEVVKLAETAGTQAADRIANAIAKNYLYQTTAAAEAGKMYQEEYEPNRDRSFMHIVRRMALADITQAVVKDSFALRASTTGSSVEMIAQTREVSVLEPPFESRRPSEPPTLADTVNFKLSFLCVLLDPRVMNTSNGSRSVNIAAKVTEYFDGAPRYGVTKAELVAIHNRVAVAVAELNNHLGTKRGNDWVKQHGIGFVDTLGAIGADKTGAYYSTKTNVVATGVSRVSDARTYSTEDSIANIYLTDRDSPPPPGYVEAFKPSRELEGDVDVLDATRGQLQDRRKEDQFLHLVQYKALRDDLVNKSHYELRKVRTDVPVPPGYETLIAEAQQIETPLARIVGEMPSLPGILNSTEEDELAGYFEYEKFPDSGITAGAKRAFAKNTAKSFLKNKWGVDIGDFDDKARYQLDDAFRRARYSINTALEAKQQEAWQAYQAKFEIYRKLLETTLATIKVTPASFARQAIEKHQLLDPTTRQIRGFWFEDPPVQGKTERKEVHLETLGAQETGDLNTIAKIVRESSEAYAAFLRPIIQAFNEALARAKSAGKHGGEQEFRDKVLLPAWQKLRPGEYGFNDPGTILDVFADEVMQPILEARAEVIKEKRATSASPVDNLAKTSSVVTRTVGTMLQ